MVTRRDSDAWFRQPVVWLGALILAVTIAGCVATILLAWRFADAPIDGDGRHARSAPLEHAADARPPAQQAR
ncbi:MAG TPA: hypothetical protein VMN79_17565 [Casimicrobiaceae bacterium]|nr:hypothetical protein [Casimicrobiaceae bacterium]